MSSEIQHKRFESLLQMPSSYSLLKARLSDPKALQEMCFELIAYPHLLFEVEDSYWKTIIGHRDLVARQQVLGILYRKKTPRGFRDPKFDFKLRRIRRQDYIGALRPFIEAEADLWIACWKVAEKLQSFGGWHPALWLVLLVSESNGLTRPWLRYSEGSNEWGARSFVKKIQSENKSLQDLSNPFSELQPLTFDFTRMAIALSDIDIPIKDDWMKLVRCRMKLVTLIKNSHSRVLQSDGTVRTAGRRKAVNSEG